MLSKNADPNIQDSFGNTPLLWAVKEEISNL
jgi:ankyrin repeat protein